MKINENIPEDRVSSEEAAKIIGAKNKRCVTRLCKQGKISPAYKVLRVWQIPLSSLHKYMNENSNIT